MTEYVYALHDFIPERDDEIAFEVGEKIEVIEKDDTYGDGWWQGRNPAGKVGLFPQAYTTASAPLYEIRTPTAPSLLQPLVEEAESPMESAAPSSNDGAVMAATLTDVQEAIEQLGVRGDHDAARSFSFASTRDGETDKEIETDDEAEGWHKDARRALAERAKRENARKEVEGGEESPSQERLSPLPITAELSDESDVEGDEEVLRNAGQDVHPHHHKYTNSASTAREISLNHPPPEPLQPAISLVSGPNSSLFPQPQEVLVAATTAQPKVHTPTTATLSRFPLPEPPKPDRITTSNLSVASSPTAGATAVVPSLTNGAAILQDPATPPQPFSPAPALVPASATASTSATGHAELVRESLKRTHPSEWSVEQVVAWLRTKNIDEPTCGKFIEHEITGDVLLELDVSLLKELDISAFGKRMRIANAIVELRRPASFSSDQQGAQYVLSGLSSPGAVLSAESPPHTGDIPVSPFTHRQNRSSGTSADGRLGGLGIVAQKVISLQPSPSDGALHPKAPSLHEELVPEGGGEDVAQEVRGVQSETETPSSATRRNFLGRSTESGSSKDKDRDSGSKDSPLSSPTLDELGGKQHARGKRSLDGSTKGAGDRLSFFGGTLGKSRKPPPRYSLHESDTSPQQQPTSTIEWSSRSISRLYLGHGKKNGRPTTPARKEKFDWTDVKEKEKEKEGDKVKEKGVNGEVASRDPALLRKRPAATTASPDDKDRPTPIAVPGAKVVLHPGQSVLDQIGPPDHAGWLRKKGERYNTWKLRYMVLKGPHLYYLRSNSHSETKIKGYIKVQGYKVVADENANPGKYGFRIVHDVEPSHFFSSEEQMVVREWMKSLMKATIDRDYSQPVVSSCNIPTIPLAVAQAMSPTPRPPSPSARAATQRALRRENPNQLSSRDARVLMGLPSHESSVLSPNGDRSRLSFFDPKPKASDVLFVSPTPPRPPRDARGSSLSRGSAERDLSLEVDLIEWANNILPERYRINDITTDLTSGLVLFRLAETIDGQPSDPPVPDSIFLGESNLEGMFKLFDFLLDHDVKMGSVSINDVKQGRPDKTTQLLRSLKLWEEKRSVPTMSTSVGKGVS